MQRENVVGPEKVRRTRLWVEEITHNKELRQKCAQRNSRRKHAGKKSGR